MSFINKKSVAIAVLSGLVLLSSNASADENWKKDHKRRVEVNKRLHNQDKRINKEEKEGEISPEQAKKLHREDHKIRQEERDMASQNGGHITKDEQKTLNEQENQTSRQIGQ